MREYSCSKRGRSQTLLSQCCRLPSTSARTHRALCKQACHGHRLPWYRAHPCTDRPGLCPYLCRHLQFGHQAGGAPWPRNEPGPVRAGSQRPAVYLSRKSLICPYGRHFLQTHPRLPQRKQPPPPPRSSTRFSSPAPRLEEKGPFQRRHGRLPTAAPAGAPRTQAGGRLRTCGSGARDFPWTQGIV